MLSTLTFLTFFPPLFCFVFAFPSADIPAYQAVPWNDFYMQEAPFSNQPHSQMPFASTAGHHFSEHISYTRAPCLPSSLYFQGPKGMTQECMPHAGKREEVTSAEHNSYQNHQPETLLAEREEAESSSEEGEAVAGNWKASWLILEMGEDKERLPRAKLWHEWKWNLFSFLSGCLSPIILELHFYLYLLFMNRNLKGSTRDDKVLSFCCELGGSSLLMISERSRGRTSWVRREERERELPLWISSFSLFFWKQDCLVLDWWDPHPQTILQACLIFLKYKPLNTKSFQSFQGEITFFFLCTWRFFPLDLKEELHDWCCTLEGKQKEQEENGENVTISNSAM